MILNKETKYWEEKDGKYTSFEIAQQPNTWQKTIKIVEDNKAQLNDFLDKVFKNDDYEIILTGAGTSEFVGNSIFPYLSTILDYKIKSYGTTDIVETPRDYFHPKRKTLLVSFARSGNSPESVAAVEVANKVCENLFHLFVTCNVDGELNKYGQKHKENCFVLNMPDETCDKSFAMTSSYSNMYLATLVTFMQYKGIDYKDFVKQTISKTQKFLDEKVCDLEKIISEFDFERIVYLGANCLKGVSQEAALKICELTHGDIMTTYDSSMGFRHGPKSVVKDNSLIVCFVSDNDYQRQYDLDIIREIVNDKIGKVLVVASNKNLLEDIKYDYCLDFENEFKTDNVFLGLQYICVAQIIGLLKSIKTGHTPDNPCPTGEVNRVVQGVIIHEFE